VNWPSCRVDTNTTYRAILIASILAVEGGSEGGGPTVFHARR